MHDPVMEGYRRRALEAEHQLAQMRLLPNWEMSWRAGYGEAIRRMTAGESIDEQEAWDSTEAGSSQRLGPCAPEVES